MKGEQSSQNSESRKGSARHNAKVKTQASQVRGQGAMTGGFATSPGAPKISNTAGKFYTKGKN